MPTRDLAPAGAPCWVDLFTTEPEKTKPFYAALFGWTVDEAGADYGGYANFSKDGRPVAGLRRHFQPGRRLLVLTSDGAGPAAIARCLVADGYGDSRVTVLEAMGDEAERRTDVPAAALQERFGELNLVAVELCATAQPRPSAGQVVSITSRRGLDPVGEALELLGQLGLGHRLSPVASAGTSTSRSRARAAEVWLLTVPVLTPRSAAVSSTDRPQ